MSNELVEQLEPLPLKDNVEVFGKINAIINEAMKNGEMPLERVNLEELGDSLSAIWISNDGEIASFITLFQSSPGKVWIDAVYTDVKFRRQGLADRLFSSLKTQMSMFNYERIELGTKPYNEPMKALARRHGLAVSMVVMGVDLRPQTAPSDAT